MAKWVSSKFKGVRFYEHPQRKHGVRFDRYYAIRYQLNGRRAEEGLGWSSSGWSEQKAALELASLKEAAKKGSGPVRLKQKREIAETKREAEKQQKAAEERESVTISQYFEKVYLPATTSDGKSLTALRTEISLFKVWIRPGVGDLPFKEISPIHIEKIRSNMAKVGRAPRSIEYMLSLTRQIFNHAAKSGQYEGKNPVYAVKKPRFDNGRLRFLSRQEADLLLNALRKKNQNIYEMALISLHCGLRFGEITALTWSDVDRVHGTLTLRDTKNKRSRTVFMSKAVKSLMSVKEPGSASDYVFLTGKGNRIMITPPIFRRVVQDLGFNDGIEDRRQKVCFHSLRHTHASWLVQAGTDLFTIQKQLGHTTGAMTQRYSHLQESHFKTVTKVFDDIKKPDQRAKKIPMMTTRGV
ncbi:MAG: site-specific integrase [Thermodesulfobacteriota bacterium]|nr:site-specific integrase [Thermodesulfobacteriota bacterium]